MDQQKIEEKKVFAKLHTYADPIEFRDLQQTPCDYILRCVDGPYEGKQLRLKELGDEIIIGSDKSCNFYLMDETMSNQHSKLSYVHDTSIYLLEDLDSKNGTWIKVSSLEDCYEITENTQFKIFEHQFEIIFNLNNNNLSNNNLSKKESSNLSNPSVILPSQNNEKSHIVKFTNGIKAGSEYVIEEESSLMLGKKGSDIELDLQCSENHFYKILKTKNRIFIINCSEEMSEKGLFYRISKKDPIIIRGGDIFKIGKSTFRLLVHNWGFFSEIGDRTHQEDKQCVIDDLRLFDEMVIPYYAVYDGHGGVSCSLYLQKHLHKNLRELIRAKNLQENSKNFFDDLCAAIQEAIIYTDINYYETEATAIHHGSTCVFIFFIGHKILCCNLGDSISILVKNDKKVYLSRDFRPTREKEKGRIESRKGYVTSDGRLLGVISVSRGFGDWKFKDPKKKEIIRKIIANKTLEFDEYLISNRAEFRIIDYDSVEDQYIIIVSDGIFQHCPNDNYIFDTINKNLSNENKKENGFIKNIPNVVDNVRLDIINSIYSDPNTKGKADNMTLILIHLQK